jgi:hypothetical protein
MIWYVDNRANGVMIMDGFDSFFLVDSGVALPCKLPHQTPHLAQIFPLLAPECKVLLHLYCYQ